MGRNEEGRVATPPSIWYLILVIWGACDLNLVMVSLLASKWQDFKLRGLQFHFIWSFHLELKYKYKFNLPYETRAEICQIFVCFWGNWVLRKYAFEKGHYTLRRGHIKILKRLSHSAEFWINFLWLACLSQLSQ